ncbi:MAG: esterase/lipase family protein [Gammaproteobacteria bacterium]
MATATPEHDPAEAIVLIHGLWVNGIEMSLLKRRLRKRGYPVYQFRYHSVLNSPAENAASLASFVAKLPHPTLHFVCHSLGGLVIRHYFASQSRLKPGRIVTLGSPHQGSGAARHLRRLPAGDRLFGKSLEQGLLGACPPWSGNHALGSIAGTLNLGLGRLLLRLPAPNDGAVTVAETQLENMADHLQLHVSHLGLVLSRTTSLQCEHFIRHSEFKR